MPTRLIRILVYEGTHEQIQSAIEKRGVKGSYRIKAPGALQDDLLIREAILGDFLEEFDYPPADANIFDDGVAMHQLKRLWKLLGADNQSNAIVNLEEIRRSRDNWAALAASAEERAGLEAQDIQTRNSSNA